MTGIAWVLAGLGVVTYLVSAALPINEHHHVARWISRHIIAPDPHPEPSRLDRMDRDE